jgi:hypothetical protein
LEQAAATIITTTTTLKTYYQRYSTLRTPQHNQTKARDLKPFNIDIITFSIYYLAPSGIAYLDVACLKPIRDRCQK